MPKGPRREKRSRYQIEEKAIENAINVATISTGEIEEDIDPNMSAAAVELGSRGGKARASRLTPEQRKEIAKKAALARWRRGQST